MSDTAILSTLLSVVGALLCALYALWLSNQRRSDASIARLGERVGAAETTIATITSQNARQERDVVALQKQNTEQETALGRLIERMTAREDAHAEHRENVQIQFARFEAALSSINQKLDNLLGRRTPYPTQYGQQQPERK